MSKFTRFALFSFFFFVNVSVKALEVDFSRRNKPWTSTTTDELKDPLIEKTQKSWLDSYEGVDPIRDVVILNTESGFIPSRISIKKGQRYNVVVVNLNQQQKICSFIMQAFGEHHSTIFGERKTFILSPKEEGIFSFISPETGKQGELVVIKNLLKNEKTNSVEER